MVILSLTELLFLITLKYAISLAQLQPISIVGYNSLMDKNLKWVICTMYHVKNQSLSYLFTAYLELFTVLALTSVTDAKYWLKGPIAMRRLPEKSVGCWVIKDSAFRGHAVKFAA